MTKYNNYKDSGIEWLGQVPEHWELRKNKYLLSLNKDVVGDSHINYDLLSLTLQGVIKRDMENPKGKFPAEFNTYQVVNPSDLIFCLFDVEETPRAIGLSPHKGMITGAYTVMTCKPDVSSKYMYYYYLSLDEKKRLKYLYTGLRNTISKDTFFAIKSPVPTEEEQGKIVTFLDHKCAQIDRFISKKQELIARLEEKKQAVINQAVTKGLDPTVKMKPSGVEWLGDVPEHWEVRKLKFLIKGKLKYGANESGVAFREDYPRYIRITDFGKGGELSDENKLSLEPEKSKDYILKDGDILLARSGATVGKAYQFKGIDLACYAGYLIKAEADESLILSDFLYAYTKSKAYDSWKSFIYSKATIENISADKYAYLMVCYPNIEEQRKILAFVEEEASEINTAITRIQEEITLIEEYKSALISEAVTGKIDVRAWQPKTTKTATL